MSYSANISFEDAAREATIVCRTLIREIIAAEERYKYFLDAQNGETVLSWSRSLYGLVDTGLSTLTVDATAKTISALPGSNAFLGITVGRNVQLNSFTNAGNNQTTEITAATPDTITIAGATGLVDETDTSARVQENTIQSEQDSVQALIDAMFAVHEIYQFADNVATPTQGDRFSLLRDFG